MKIIIKIIITTLLIAIYSCSSCPSAYEIRQLEEQFAAREDSIKQERFAKHIFELYDSIKIPKNWKQIEREGNTLDIDLTTEPAVGVFATINNGRYFGGYLNDFKTYNDSICFDSSLFDSLTTFIYKPLKNNNAIWCVYKPQLNHYRQLGIYKAFNRD